MIGIVGKIQLEQFVNKEGAKQQTVKIIIDNWQLLDSRRDSDNQPPNPKLAGAIDTSDIDDPFAD